MGQFYNFNIYADGSGDTKGIAGLSLLPSAAALRNSANFEGWVFYELRRMWVYR